MSVKGANASKSSKSPNSHRRQIGYYQWVSFVLAIAALMFHLPALCWRMLSNQSGLSVSVVLSVACQEDNVDPEVRDRAIDVLAVSAIDEINLANFAAAH